MNDKYIVLDSINAGHKIFLAKNIQDNSICVKKIMSVYNLDVYKRLKEMKPFGIPSIYDLDFEENDLVVYEEYIQDFNLEDKINNGLILSKDQIIDICFNIAKILESLNNSTVQIVHRDIKPSNIIYTNNEIYLLDFNAAKIVDNNKSKDTTLLGTEGYAAPEQYGFAASSIKSDIYAIGILLKELTNKMDIHDNSINNIVSKCTMIDPNKRYLSYYSLMFDLKHPSKYGSRRLYPVGFRSRKPLNMVVATLTYLLIVFMFTGLEVQDGSLFEAYMYRIFFTTLGFVLVGFLGNYLEWWEKWGFKQSWSPVIKIIWVAVIFTAIFIVTTIAFLLILGIAIQFI